MKPFTLWILNHNFENDPENDVLTYNPRDCGVFDKHYHLVFFGAIDLLWEYL